jgi:hypothetical protein
LDEDVEVATHYWSSNFVVTGLVDDELEGVAKVANVAVEAEVVCL